MNKRDKALLKLLGMIASQLVVIAANLAFSNTIKTTTGASRTNMFKDNSRVMKSNIDLIDNIIKEALDEQY